jgi:hypothetical protein
MRSIERIVEEKGVGRNANRTEEEGQVQRAATQDPVETDFD